MTDDQLNAIKLREGKTSPGPWFVTRIPNRYPSDKGDGRTHPALRGMRVPKRLYEVAPGQVELDMEYMAASRADIPALLNEVDRLRSTILEIREMLLNAVDQAPQDGKERLLAIESRVQLEEQYWHGVRSAPSQARLDQLRAERTLVP